MSEYVGIFKLFAVIEVWAVALFVLMVCSPLGIMFVLADRSAGLFFNVSYSGVIGDMLLTIAILIGATVLQRGAPLPGWMNSIWPQVCWLSFCVLVGFIMGNVKSPLPTDTLSDRYHNFVVLPIYLFLVPAMALVIWYNGMVADIVIGLLLVAVWASLVWFDFDNKRLDQPTYVHQHFGFIFHGGKLMRRF